MNKAPKVVWCLPKKREQKINLVNKAIDWEGSQGVNVEGEFDATAPKIENITKDSLFREETKLV